MSVVMLKKSSRTLMILSPLCLASLASAVTGSLHTLRIWKIIISLSSMALKCRFLAVTNNGLSRLRRVRLIIFSVLVLMLLLFPWRLLLHIRLAIISLSLIPLCALVQLLLSAISAKKN